MPTDLNETYQTVAVNLLNDLRSTIFSGGLDELRKYCCEKNPSLEGVYVDWRKAFDALAASVGIEADQHRGGMSAPGGLTPNGIAGLHNDQLQTLIQLADPESKVRKSINVGAAGYFLGDFFRNYTVPLQLILCERRKPQRMQGAKEFTEFWTKYSKTLLEMVKTTQYSDFYDFVNQVHALDPNINFPSHVGMGLVHSQAFNADPDKLIQALLGNGISSHAIMNFDRRLSKLLEAALTYCHYNYERQVRDMRKEFQAVKLQLDECLADYQKLNRFCIATQPWQRAL